MTIQVDHNRHGRVRIRKKSVLRELSHKRDHATLLEKRKKGSDVMENQTIRLDEAEVEIFTYEVSDEALEGAGGDAKERVSFTLGACTGLSVCPG